MNGSFLKAISKTFRAYNIFGARSNKKLIPIHKWIAETIEKKLGKEFSVRSLGKSGECQLDGKYYLKTLDISILKNKKIIVTISFKFVTSNYKQNSNNYFENLLGETANIRRVNIDFAHFLVLRAYTPYYDKNKGSLRGKEKKIEVLNENDLVKYVKLFNDADFPHKPEVLGITVIDFNKQKHAYFADLENLKLSDKTKDILKNQFSLSNFIDKVAALCRLKSYFFMAINNKKINGVVYTPKWIVDLILDQIDYKNNVYNKKIIDPACGDGAFLSEALVRFIKDAKRAKINNGAIKEKIENNIFGFDTDKNAIKECILVLNDIAEKYNLKNIKWNILKTDSSDKSFVSKFFNFFDFVVGNPPYIRIQHLGLERRGKIQNEWLLSKRGSTDMFIVFFELGYCLLNKNGKLGYITPNTYFKTQAGKDLRDFIKFHKILKILIDFEHNQLFDDATTYSLITILDKNHKKSVLSLFKGNKENINYIDEIDVENLNQDNWILTSSDILDKLNKIEKRGVPLGKIAKIHVGITTLADDYYIFKDPAINGNFAEIKLKDGGAFQIEKEILKPIIKASILKNPNEDQNRFIIFPYKKIGNKHFVIEEKELKEKFPLTYKYFKTIKKILNNRDKGKPNPIAWYAFGRSQGLETSFGKKILTSPLNLRPNFIVWEKEEYTFYAGYCIKFDGDLKLLAHYLNSKDMEFYINYASRNYQNNYKSFAKIFIEKFGIQNINLIEQKQRQLSVF